MRKLKKVAITAVSPALKERVLRAKSNNPVKLFGRVLTRKGVKPLIIVKKSRFSHKDMSDGKIVVASGTRRVGKLDFVEGYAGENRTYFSVKNLVVKKEYENQGIATQMLLEVIVAAKKKKSRYVLLDAEINNLRAIKLYKKLGFVAYDKYVGHIKGSRRQRRLLKMKLDL